MGRKIRTLRFGVFLRKIRELSGYTQQELADLVGSHKSHISSMEHGVRGISIQRLHEILLCFPRMTIKHFDELVDIVNSEPVIPGLWIPYYLAHTRNAHEEFIFLNSGVPPWIQQHEKGLTSISVILSENLIPTEANLWYF